MNGKPVLCQTELSDVLNFQQIRHVGWGSTEQFDSPFKQLWTKQNLEMIQRKITELLMGVDKNNRPIIVPVDKIASVMNSVYDSHRPQIGDIYSRFILPEMTDKRNDIRDIIDRTIEIITSTIRNEYEIIENNKKLTVWNTLYGDFNKEGLRAHAPIKIRKGGPMRFQFHMNY